MCYVRIACTTDALTGTPLRTPRGFNEPQMRCFNDVVNI